MFGSYAMHLSLRELTLRRLGLALALLACLVGCGPGKTAPVNGRVKLKDGSDVSVLKGYSLTFEAEGGKTSAVGEVNADGTFMLSTFGANDGAVPGKYRVAINPLTNPNPDKPPTKSKLPAKYENLDSSGLTVEVKPGQNRIELELDKAP
jgi:hypothetical protein